MNIQSKKYLIVLTSLLVLPSSVMAAPLWSDVANNQATAARQPASNPHAYSRHVTVDYAQLQSTLAKAATSSTGGAQQRSVPAQLELPMPDGSQQVFNIAESSIMEPELAAKYPQIKTYTAVAENDATVSGRLDIGPRGFHGYLFTNKGEVYIDPVSVSSKQEYYSYYKRDVASLQSTTFSCGVQAKSADESPVNEFKDSDLITAARTSDTTIRYQLAVATTGEYSQAVKQPSSTTDAEIKADALAAVNTAINRINQIYQRDLAVELFLVANNDLIIHTNASTDPYTDPADSPNLLTENQASLDSIIGSANYDIGHVFTTSPGGLASLGVACVSNFKARGETGVYVSELQTDIFYIDYVAHELGHQFGGNHSFNGTSGSCTTRVSEAAYEPGSGSTIMAYAGICSGENVAAQSDATFHAGSIAEIINYTRMDTGNTCSESLPGQQAPVVEAGGPNYTIPGGTAFTLTAASVTDSDTALSNLTYQWDQMDRGTFTDSTTYGTDNGSNPLFRSFEPVATAERTFPQLSTILSNVPDKAETLPTENRTLNFRLTARDGSGGVDEDDVQVTIDGDAGPFEVLQPNTSITLDSSSSQVIEWNTACTDTAPVSCANVDILLSTDGGQTFSSLVGGSTANDGSQSVTIPAGDTSTARIKIACVGNIFFDISDVDFAISSVSGSTLTATGTPESCGTATGSGTTTGDDIEPNNFPAQAQTLTIPSTLNASVNDVSDDSDFFVFVADAGTYTFTLNGFGSNDLDLYLYDSTGLTIVAESYTVTPTETFTQTLTAGATYYIEVDAWDTGGSDSPYTLDVQVSTNSGGGSSGGGGGGALTIYGLLMMLIMPLFRNRSSRKIYQE